MERPPRLPIGVALGALARQRPDAAAVSCAGATVTRAELEVMSNRLARAYAELGVGLGDVVTISLPNGIEFYAATCAVWKLGAVPLPVSSRLPERERSAIIELADSRLLVGVEPGIHGDRRAVPAGFAPATLDAEPLPPAVSPSWKAATSGGSTGRPKLIVARPSGVVDVRFATSLGVAADGTQLVAGPLYHSMAFMFSMWGLFLGNHLVVLPRFDAEAALQAIDEHGVDWLAVTPTMMRRMLRLIEAEPGRFHLRSVRQLWHTASPCPAWLKRAWIDILGPERVFELYGGTEAQGVTVISGQEWLDRPGSVGRAVSGEVAVLDEHGERVPSGTLGEVFMRTSREGTSTYKYVRGDVKRHGRWETLGDLGWMDEDGFLYLVERRQDLILSGGANVYPAEVENAVLEHPAVESCIVVGLPDDDLGQRVHAIVHLDGTATVDELWAFTAERLVRYKVPRTWEFVDEALRDDAGKARRSALAEERRNVLAAHPVSPNVP